MPQKQSWPASELAFWLPAMHSQPVEDQASCVPVQKKSRRALASPPSFPRRHEASACQRAVQRGKSRYGFRLSAQAGLQ